MVFEDKSTAFDERIFSLINPHINDSNTRLMRFITFFGSPPFLLSANVVLICIFLFIKTHRWYSVKIAAIALTSTAVLFLLKGILQRERPLLPVIAKVHGYSFPSGHSFSSLVFFGMLSYIAYKTIKNKALKTILIIACFAFAILVGFSRIYLKVHYASDVIAGLCLGAIWLVLGRWLLVKTQKIEPK
jgi:membrane-associated phospholipid phosphatase